MKSLNKSLLLVFGSLLFLFGSVLWFVSLYMENQDVILIYDKLAAGTFIIGSLLFLIDLM
mgnify:CR=1 FL=1